MSIFIFENNINSSLSTAIDSSTTSISLSSSSGLPSSIPSGTYLVLTLNDLATRGNFEIVYATAISGATLTVLRAQEGTSALSWLVGDYVFSGITAGQMDNFFQGPTFSQKPYYTANQSGPISININTTYSIAALAVTFPSFSKTGAFRVRAYLLPDGISLAANQGQNFLVGLTDGTNTIEAGTHSIYSSYSAQPWAVDDVIETDNTYSPSSTVIFTMQVTTGAGSTSYTLLDGQIRLFVEEA